MQQVLSSGLLVNVLTVSQKRDFNELTWTKEDWRDCYQAMEDLKVRIATRHGILKP